jgi:hypothetical protein
VFVLHCVWGVGADDDDAIAAVSSMKKFEKEAMENED